MKNKYAKLEPFFEDLRDQGKDVDIIAIMNSAKAEAEEVYRRLKVFGFSQRIRSLRYYPLKVPQSLSSRFWNEAMLETSLKGFDFRDQNRYEQAREEGDISADVSLKEFFYNPENRLSGSIIKDNQIILVDEWIKDGRTLAEATISLELLGADPRMIYAMVVDLRKFSSSFVSAPVMNWSRVQQILRYEEATFKQLREIYRRHLTKQEAGR